MKISNWQPYDPCSDGSSVQRVDKFRQACLTLTGKPEEECLKDVTRVELSPERSGSSST